MTSPVSPEGSQLQFLSTPAVVISIVVVIIGAAVVIGGSSQVSSSVHGCGTMVNLQASVFPPLKIKS